MKQELPEDHFEQFIRKTLDGFDGQPPKNVWEGLNERLVPPKKVAQGSRMAILSGNRRWKSLAALLLLFLMSGAVFFGIQQYQQNKNLQAQISILKSEQENLHQKTDIILEKTQKLNTNKKHKSSGNYKKEELTKTSPSNTDLKTVDLAKEKNVLDAKVASVKTSADQKMLKNKPLNLAEMLPQSILKAKIEPPFVKNSMKNQFAEQENLKQAALANYPQNTEASAISKGNNDMELAAIPPLLAAIHSPLDQSNAELVQINSPLKKGQELPAYAHTLSGFKSKFGANGGVHFYLPNGGEASMGFQTGLDYRKRLWRRLYLATGLSYYQSNYQLNMFAASYSRDANALITESNNLSSNFETLDAAPRELSPTYSPANFYQKTTQEIRSRYVEALLGLEYFLKITPKKNLVFGAYFAPKLFFNQNFQDGELKNLVVNYGDNALHMNSSKFQVGITQAIAKKWQTQLTAFYQPPLSKYGAEIRRAHLLGLSLSVNIGRL